jgi:probable F420-dependent oxidoreductase
MAGPRDDLGEALGRVGVWTFALDARPASEAREFVSEMEELGYGALWIPEAVGSKEVFAHAGTLLAAGRSIVVATGIASIWARDPMAMANGSRTLADAYPGRFLLGIGVSHGPAVSKRGHAYERPLRRMREYLQAMDAARYSGPEPAQRVPRVLAALGPKMLGLAAARTDGAHPYFVPVEHTARARAALGGEPLLAPEQAAVLETDAGAARMVARRYMGSYLRLPNYANNLLRLGWADEDLQGGGSDRLVDAIVVWGDEGAIRERVRAHLDAGADHVALQVLDEDPTGLARRQLRDLAPALLT